MSDVVKWAALVVGLVAIAAVLMGMPVAIYMNIPELASAIDTIVYYASVGLTFGRGLINNFFTEFGRTALSSLMIYFFAKWAVTIGFKILVWAYHFIFK